MTPELEAQIKALVDAGDNLPTIQGYPNQCAAWHKAKAALANAHKSVERERYYVEDLEHHSRIIAREEHEEHIVLAYPRRFYPNATDLAAAEAARLNAECDRVEVERLKAWFRAESQRGTPPESAPPEPDRSRTPTFEEMHRRCGPPPSGYPHNRPPASEVDAEAVEELRKQLARPEPEEPTCPIEDCDKTYPHLHPPESKVPEGPWRTRFGPTTEYVVEALSPDLPREALFLTHVGPGRIDEQLWLLKKNAIRHAVRCVNAEPRHERVENMTRQLVNCIMDGDVTKPNYPARAQARDLKTELEKTDAE